MSARNFFPDLSDEELEDRLKLPWWEFTQVGCMRKPHFWQRQRRKQFKKLVAELQLSMFNELIGRRRVRT